MIQATIIDGSEFISRNFDLWDPAKDVSMGFPRPGKPTDNGFIEAFNPKLRAECLNARRHCRSDQWRFNGEIMSLADGREKLEDWRRHDNEDRPHCAIGYNVPIAVHHPDGVTNPSS